MAGIPEPAERNFGEGNVCTCVDPQERARIANVLALETAIQGEEIAVQAEEIERLQVILEQSITIILCPSMPIHHPSSPTNSLPPLPLYPFHIFQLFP
jgi:hypothetical protein